MKFPVFSLYNRELGAETGSLETASSSVESAANRAGTPVDVCFGIEIAPVERVEQRFDSTTLILVTTGSRPAPIGTPP